MSITILGFDDVDSRLDHSPPFEKTNAALRCAVSLLGKDTKLCGVIFSSDFNRFFFSRFFFGCFLSSFFSRFFSFIE